MVLQGCKSTPQKSRPSESGHGRHAVQVANMCSYKLSYKSEFQFLCEPGWFLHGQSHIYIHSYVTGFAKTRRNVARTEIHFIA